MITDLRLRIIHFFRRNKIIVFIVFSVVLMIFMLNLYLKTHKAKPVPKTTYTPHTSVMNSSKKGMVKPRTLSGLMEEMEKTL